MRQPITTPRDAVEREADLPSISALRAFVLSAQLRSFSRAADELDITQSGISRAVRGLEEIAGTALFERTGHGLVLTEPGRAYFEDVTALLSELGSATLRLSTYSRGSERLVIAALPSLGARWLAPRLGRFSQQNPTIDITVEAQIGHFDFTESAADVAIHYGNEPWADCLSEILMDEVLVPMCAPELLPRGQVASADMLLNLPLIQHMHRPTAWREWFRDAAIAHPNPTSGLKFEQYQMGIEAAKAGAGAILMPPFMVMEEMQQHRLIPLHATPMPTPWRYYLVYPKSKRSNPAVQKFRSWIKAEARRTQSQTAQLIK